MLRFFFLSFIILFPFFSQPGIAQSKKTYQITGVTNNGTNKSFTVKWRRLLREPNDFDPILTQQGDMKEYTKFGYTDVGPPTWRQNCAGNVIEHFWNIPYVYTPAPDFYKDIIQPFFEEKNSPAINDVVVFGPGNHVAIVVGFSNGKPVIRSKDNQETVVQGVLGYWSNDPIIRKNGPVKYYRKRQGSNLTVKQTHNEFVDPDPIGIIIEVKEEYQGNLYPIDNAQVEVTAVGGGIVKTGSTNSAGMLAFTLNNKFIIEHGMNLKATKTGFYDKTDLVDYDISNRKDDIGWILFMKRDFSELETKLAEIEKRTTAAEGNKTTLQQKINEIKTQLKTLTDLKSEVEGLKTDVDNLKTSVDKIKVMCADYKTIVANLESIVKKGDQLDVEFEKLLDKAGMLRDKCDTKADAQAMRDALEDAVVIVGKIKEVKDELVIENNKLQKLILEYAKEAQTEKKVKELLTKINSKKSENTTAHNALLGTVSKILELKGKLVTAHAALTVAIGNVKPLTQGRVPADLINQFNSLDSRIAQLDKDIDFKDDSDVYKSIYEQTNNNLETAKATLDQYKGEFCKMDPKNDLVSKVDGLLSAAMFGLGSISDLEDKAKECEDRLDCDKQIALIEPLLEKGDSEAARIRIDQLIQIGCDVTAIEAEYWRVHTIVYPLLSRAKDAWNGASNTCEYEKALEAAMELYNAYPEHPWILKNLAEIKKAAEANKKVEQLLANATNADSKKDYETAEKFIDQADQAATAYPCLKDMVKRYREEFEKGKPNPEYLKLLLAALEALKNCEWEKALGLRSQARDIATDPALATESEARSAKALDDKIKEFADAEKELKAIQEKFKSTTAKNDWEKLKSQLEAVKRKLAPCHHKIQPSVDDLIATVEKQIARGGGPLVSEQTIKDCNSLIAEIQQLLASGNNAGAANKLRKAQLNCKDFTSNIDSEINKAEQQLEQIVESLKNEIGSLTGKCSFEAALKKAQEIEQIDPTEPWLTLEYSKLKDRAAAQRDARTKLLPAQAAIQSKDLVGAIAALRQAESVPNLPDCMKKKIKTMRQDLEKRKEFVDLTEKLELASSNCQYDQAETLIGRIKSIRISEPSSQQIVNNWLTINEPKLADLKDRKRRSLESIKNAKTLADQADALSKKDQPDWSVITPILQNAARSLATAENTAPKCVRDMEKQRIDDIRQLILSIQKRKKNQIQVSIALLIDASGSMGEKGKMEKAKRAAYASVSNVSKTTEMAILSFSGGCGPGGMRIASGFSTNSTGLIEAIGGISPGGGTPMYVSTAAAVKWVQQNGKGKKRSIVLLSDGADTCNDQKTKAGATVRSSNIPVSTIGFDVDNNEQAQRELKELASMSKGKNYSAGATDPREIRRVMIEAVMQGLLKPADIGSSHANNALVSGYFDQAQDLIDQQNLSGALFQYQQAYKVAPNSPSINFNLSLVYEAEDQLISAKKHAEEYLKLSPDAYDSNDVKVRIEYIKDELTKNPRFKGDPNQCTDLYLWAQKEQRIVKRTKNNQRHQAVLEIMITAQKGDCPTARQLESVYLKKYE